MIATAINIKTCSGDCHLFCEPDGFIAEGLIVYLKQEFKDEYPWIEEIGVKALNWDIKTLNIDDVFEDIYNELDKLAEEGE